MLGFIEVEFVLKPDFWMFSVDPPPKITQLFITFPFPLFQFYLKNFSKVSLFIYRKNQKPTFFSHQFLDRFHSALQTSLFWPNVFISEHPPHPTFLNDLYNQVFSYLYIIPHQSSHSLPCLAILDDLHCVLLS